ncbi:hypothetical protein [Bdellovibrio bacteriovorus]|uniref:hypothetical protein n=1 Tax=Bdellovibrio TaxID=958 RepID=UPI0035A965E0
MTTERYKVVGGVQIIEIRVNDIQQLFDFRDPAPFRERDLDENFTHYLEAYLDELSVHRPFKIQIDIARPRGDVTEQVIRDAIHEYFLYQIQIKQGQFSKNIRAAQLFLFIGLFILAVCLGLAQLIKQIESEIVSTTLREGVVIFGWVSMWKPLELLLFDWYPIYDRIRIYKRLVSAEVEVIFEGHKGSQDSG